jgi:hypothetical protein
MSVCLASVINAVLPANHGDIAGIRKGDWVCVGCGHPNKGLDLLNVLTVSKGGCMW